MTGHSPRAFNSSFHVRLHTTIDRELLNLGLATISLVWDYRIGAPQEFRVAIVDHAVAAGIDANGAYLHHQREFVFAAQSILGIHSGEALKGLMIKVAAHEAMHAVQHAQGHNLDEVLAKTPPGSTGYLESPLERAANEESLLVLKGYYRDLNGSLPYGSGALTVPAESPYAVLWDELESSSARINVLSVEDFTVGGAGAA